MNATVNFQSKYGFHPCDVEIYRKLKVIYKVYWECVYRHSAWYRWNLKDPQNRVQRWAGYDTAGRRIRLPKPLPLPEPTLPPWVIKLEHKKTVTTSVGDYKQYYGPSHDVVWHTAKIDPMIYAAVDDFRNAKTPVIETQVKPLVCSLEKIDSLYKQAVEWLQR